MRMVIHSRELNVASRQQSQIQVNPVIVKKRPFVGFMWYSGLEMDASRWQWGVGARKRVLGRVCACLKLLMSAVNVAVLVT